MNRFWNSLNLGVAHFLLFFIAIIIVTPKRTELYSMVIWLGMIIASVLIVQFYYNKSTSNKIPTRLTKNHKKTQRLALLSSVFFLLTCVAFKFFDRNNIVVPNALIAMTILSIVCTIASHIKLIDNKDKVIALTIKSAVKYSWLIVSLISYYLARSMTSGSLDISFDTTFNKLITVVTALIFIFIFYYAIYFIFISLLYSVTLSAGNRKIKSSVNLEYSISIFFPLFIIGYVSYIAFNIQTLNILRFGLEFSMKYDMRDTFFCNNKYMFLSEHPNARFMFIADGNYRALIPHNDDFTVSRLTCKDSAPFYSLVSVMEKKELILTALGKQAETLASDIKATISSNVR